MNGHAESGYAGYLSRAATQWPDKVALRFEGRCLTYAYLESATNAAVNRLAAAGIQPGMRVALLLENCPEYLIAQLALARLGATFVTPNPYWTTGELTKALESADVTGAVHATRFDEFVRRLEVKVSEDSLTDAAPRLRDSVGVNMHDTLYIPFSSGTTGLPKGVLHTAGSLCGGVDQLRRHLGLTSKDRLQIALPLCHIFGATMSAAAISVGAEITLFRRFDLDESLAHIKQARVTIWPLAGAVAHRLAGRNDLRSEDFASLRFFMWGGSALPIELAEKITASTGVRFLCSYGMTEAMMVAFNPVEDPDRWRLDSPGYATEGTELRLAANGELEVRGPSVAAGYAGTESPSFSGHGWFRTGDLAEIADDGRLRIVDRLKDVFKVSGFQVAPQEVEDALLAHPDVAEAAVIGRPDDRTGEAPVAFVVPKTKPVSAVALAGFVRDRLASYKQPREYHFVDELPRTAAGKLQRHRLPGQSISS